MDVKQHESKSGKWVRCTASVRPCPREKHRLIPATAIQPNQIKPEASQELLSAAAKGREAPSPTKRAGWQGFDGRVFLTAAEHATYLRRMPVRYAAKNLKPGKGVCELCHLPGTSANPLQAAHKVPFGIGVKLYGLTPDWLDSADNLIWAHRTRCNKQAEMDSVAIEELVQKLLAEQR